MAGWRVTLVAIAVLAALVTDAHAQWENDEGQCFETAAEACETMVPDPTSTDVQCFPPGGGPQYAGTREVTWSPTGTSGGSCRGTRTTVQCGSTTGVNENQSYASAFFTQCNPEPTPTPTPPPTCPAGVPGPEVWSDGTGYVCLDGCAFTPLANGTSSQVLFGMTVDGTEGPSTNVVTTFSSVGVGEECGSPDYPSTGTTGHPYATRADGNPAMESDLGRCTTYSSGVTMCQDPLEPNCITINGAQQCFSRENGDKVPPSLSAQDGPYVGEWDPENPSDFIEMADRFAFSGTTNSVVNYYYSANGPLGQGSGTGDGPGGGDGNGDGSGTGDGPGEDDGDCDPDTEVCGPGTFKAWEPPELEETPTITESWDDFRQRMADAPLTTAMTNFADNTGFSGSGGTCPSGSVPMFGTTIVFDFHCQLWPQIAATIAGIFMFGWTWIAFRVFGSA